MGRVTSILRALLSGFRRDGKGGVALLFGLAAPVAFGIVGVAVDYGTWVNQTTKLQHAADAAAVASARELQVGSPTDARIQALVETIVGGQIRLKEGDGPVVAQGVPIRNAQNAPMGVKVTLFQRKNAVMSRLVTPELTDISVTAVAMMAIGAKVCVVGLDETSADTIRLINRAQISAGGCSVYVNSTSPTALRSENQAKVTSLLTCTAGGYKGLGTNFGPDAPLTDCPKVADPLMERPTPPVGGCLLSTLTRVLKIIGTTTTLDPGTYCGGLYVQRGANVTLRPGTYVIKDGPLIIGPAKAGSEEDDDEDEDDGSIASRGSVKGTGVGFYFTGTIKAGSDGKKVAMRMEPNSVVEMTAPVDGPMAGLLFHQDRTSAPDHRFEILSDGARRLVGTVYLPRGILDVSANQSVADQSEYTAVVAKRIELSQGPNLVLNTRYSDTNVPVPKGLGPHSGALRLTK